MPLRRAFTRATRDLEETVTYGTEKVISAAVRNKLVPQWQGRFGRINRVDRKMRLPRLAMGIVRQVMSKSRRASIDAMLRHLASHHDPQDFPSTAYERQALIETAGKRRLIAWQKDRRRYELTPNGWRRLRRNGGLGLPALAIGAGVGAAI